MKRFLKTFNDSGIHRIAFIIIIARVQPHIILNAIPITQLHRWPRSFN